MLRDTLFFDSLRKIDRGDARWFRLTWVSVGQFWGVLGGFHHMYYDEYLRCFILLKTFLYECVSIMITTRWYYSAKIKQNYIILHLQY